jgi:serine/threonine-protein kinase
MTEVWRQWEGQVVNGEFHLRQYLGGSENSAVFLTEHGELEPQKAAIKLLVAPPEESELQLFRWELAAKLFHPHLIRLFQMGRCQLGNLGLLYVVMEYAEENLSQILSHQTLTPADTREMLEPVLDALAYVHGEGFVHGHIKPANIMGVEGQLKISTDGLFRMGEARVGLGKPSVYDAPEMAGGWISAAADIWSLGMTLVEGLTQRLPVWRESDHGEPVLPETLPAQFLELARHCLRRDLQRRWTVADIVAHIRQTQPALQAQTAARASVKWRYVAPAVVLGLLAAMLVVPRFFNDHREAQPTPSAVATQTGVQSQPAVAPKAGKSTAQRTDEKKEGSPHAAPGRTRVQSEAGPPTTVGLVPGKIVRQVLPDVPRKARDTIRGTVRVGVRVRVDPSGVVAGVKLDSPGPSRYFARLALKAARRWKFRPAEVDATNVASEWILRFQFEKAGTTVLPVHATP